MPDPVRDEQRPEHEMPKNRPWGPASYWRSGVVLMALIIAGVIAVQWMTPATQ